MKLSTRGRYGVRFMFDLASHYGEGPIFLKDIAQRQGISEKYLWHLVTTLKAAGLITTVRGAKGGYYLSRSPQDINLMDVVRVLVSLIASKTLPFATGRRAAFPGRYGERYPIKWTRSSRGSPWRILWRGSAARRLLRPCLYEVDCPYDNGLLCPGLSSVHPRGSTMS
jgi:biotin operon repressor